MAEKKMEEVKKPSLEKLKALQLAMDKIDKDHGRGTIMKMGDSKIEEVSFISTGSLGLDVALGVGGYLGYTGAKWENQGWGWNYSSVIVGGRAALHYQLIDKLDSYTGLMLGYNVVSSKSFGSNGSWGNHSAVGSGITYSWFLGGRYYFTDNVAGLLELGYGVSFLNIGVSFKL